jgi:hypothetical protein
MFYICRATWPVHYYRKECFIIDTVAEIQHCQLNGEMRLNR